VARIVLAVGGSIAAYKAVDLCSKCVQTGHEVDVVMTRMAMRFVGPLSFSAITHHPVHLDDTWGEGERPAAHLEMTECADLLVVAPATADLIGKFANGIADDIVTTTYLGAECPVLVAPAMNQRMWVHPRVVANIARLKADGVQIVGPATGHLAEGDEGPGRLVEPAELLAAIAAAVAALRSQK
jgi:phosphopantothenoylcysteine decarboxylase / phosphopantothenate---cysteine ligase